MEDFIAYLTSEKTNKYAFENQNHYELVMQCLQYIGDQDGEIRDHIIYPALAHLLHDKHLSKEQLTEIGTLLLSNTYLLYDMENKDKWSVLTRSFTSLQLVILVFVHNRDTVFSTEIVLQIYDTFLHYFKQEQIYQGYDETVGWVHAIAHSADVLSQLIDCKELSHSQILDMWYAVADVFVQATHIFIADEDERLVNMMEKSLKHKHLSEEELNQWIQYVSDKQLPDTFPERYHMKQNKQHLLRALYFRLSDELVSESVRNTLFEAAKNKQ